MTINFNTEPYYDDFDETKKFYRILFRPSYAVQARELTQLQTVLQNQITKFGTHVFKEGAMVIPGASSIDTKVSYIKLTESYNSVLTDTNISNFAGKTIKNSTGLQAEVLHYTVAENGNPSTLYVRYKNSDSNTTTKKFAESDVIQTIDGVYSTQVAATNATGKSSLAIIEQGVYFLKGHFVLVSPQTIVLDKYTNLPTYRIGLVCNEEIVTAEEDITLFDNAQNSFNYAAPGAHRYTIDAILTAIPDYTDAQTWQQTREYAVGDLIRSNTLYYRVIVAGVSGSSAPTHTSGDATNGTLTLAYINTYSSVTDKDSDTDFIELIRTNKGNVRKAARNTEYSVLEQEFARRTYDESGNYTVKNFDIDVREYRNNNRGQWATGRVYLQGDIVSNAGNTYVAKNTEQSSSITPIHTTGSEYDGESNGGVEWEYTEIPNYNRGIYSPNVGETEEEQKINDAKLAIGLDAGKAYVQGYEIEKTSTEYVAVNKARDDVQVVNAVIPATVGNYVLVTNVSGLPPVQNYLDIGIYDRLNGTRGVVPSGATLIGTARARILEWDNGVIGTQTSVYKLSLFDIKMVGNTDFVRKAKSFFYDGGSAALSFSADVKVIPIPLMNTVSISGTAVTGKGTNFLDDFISGDYIYANGSSYRVASVETNGGLTLTAGPGSAISDVSYARVSTTVYEPENTKLIFPLPYFAIKDVRNSLLANDTSYTVYEKFSNNATVSSTPTLTISTASGTFASAAETDNYIVVDNTTGLIINVTAGNIAPSTSTCVITLGSTYSGRSISVIAAINKTGITLTEKTKLPQYSETVQFTTAATAQKTELLLGKADAYRLVSVKMKSGTFSSYGSTYDIDITDRYDFDDGQRLTHYDISRLVLKNSYAPPEAPIAVTFDWLKHDAGDYFTVNSYPADMYNSIPTYRGSSLRDTIDFRPRLNDAGTSFTTGTNPSYSRIPKRGIDVIADFTYYLARKTKIAIDFSGEFFAIDGVSSLNPGSPPDPSMGMVLYSLTLQPYTFGTSSDNVIVEKIDNKRYTMRDIGKLEKRIDNLEYYTSLSLLEQQTESLDIVDANGDTRFKNGFIVDGFTGHNTGDATNPDYLCSIDMNNAELRPFFAMNNVNLLEKAISPGARNNRNYKMYGDVITLPVVDHLPVVTQQFASRLENINPFAVFTFIGDVKINPSSDDWFEVDRRPDLVFDVEGNFTTMKVLAEKANALGTVWNGWQTQWVGETTTTATAYYASGRNWVTWGTIYTDATPIGQARTGVKTSLVTKIDRQIVADRVLSTAVIPYMRSRNVLIQVQKLKPLTRFYPFFDDIDISAFCTPATRIVYTPYGTGTGAALIASRQATHNKFDDVTNVGGLAAEAARRIDGDSQMCLNKGEFLTIKNGATTVATAVVVGKEYNPDTGEYSLFVHNIIGTISSGNTITGSNPLAYASAATGTVVTTPTVKVLGDNLVTNYNGDVQLLFNIPNTEAVRFRCGTRELKLVDTTTPRGEFSSRARANYRAEGVLETRQQTVNAVRNAELVEEQLTENQVIIQTATRSALNHVWWDPLAQTFLIDTKGGCFLSKVDVFFATKDPAVPVMLEIREVVNGYPGKRVLPFSRVTLKPEQVNLSENTVTLNDTTVKSYDTPTTFEFPSPVYVQEGTEYAIVLASDSNNYNVWISQVGDLMPGTARTISEQPYLGSLFKSQNASTWTADQTQDLKFTIYRAKFDTGVVGNIEYVNDVLPIQMLEVNPFETRTGQSQVRVWQKDHGMPVNSKVDLVGGTFGTGFISTGSSSTTVTGIGTAFTSELAVDDYLFARGREQKSVYLGKIASIASNTSLTLAANAALTVSTMGFRYADTINGIPANQIFTTHIISDVDLDSYVIGVGVADPITTNATASGYAGGQGILATRNLQFDSIHPSITMQTFTETPVEFGFKATSGMSIDSITQNAYENITTMDHVAILPNENNSFVAPKMVASELNESDALSGEKSLSMNVLISSQNDALSPILDTHRTSLIVINNKVNYPTETNVNVDGLDDNTILSANTTIAFSSGNTVTTANSAAKLALATLTIGKYLNITGSGTSGNNGTYLITDIAADGSSVTLNKTFTSVVAGTAITLKQRERFVDETAPVESSTYSKYVTKRINLAQPSTFMKVRMAVNLPAEADIEVYYKHAVVGDNASFDSETYNLMTADAPIARYSNSNGRFVDVTYSVDELEAFDAVRVKIVLKSKNSSEVPRVKDLRIIACA